jgi:hypothetical protein
MSDRIKRKRPFPLRLKIGAVSLLSLVVTTACSLLRSRTTPTPVIMCYEMVAPNDTPTPVVMCYAEVAPTDTPTPFVTCYTAPPPTETPTPTTFTSPLIPLPTPTPTPTPTPEARHLLLQRLLAEGRLPHDVVHELES